MTRPTSRIWLVLVLGIGCIITGVFVCGIAQAGEQIATHHALLAAPPATPVAIVRFDGVRSGLVVPSWSLLNAGHRWSYAGPRQGISEHITPPLTTVTPNTRWLASPRLQPQAAAAFEYWANAARQAGRPMIITSAYRSAVEQRQVYQEIAAVRGADYARQFVARPGHSEHQLGLAVDVSRATPDCQLAFSRCRLDDAMAQWLAKTAPQYGFILRYPPGKQHITGVAPESWHFRYVGPRMARFVADSGLTFDEVIWRLQAERQRLAQH